MNRLPIPLISPPGWGLARTLGAALARLSAETGTAEDVTSAEIALAQLQDAAGGSQ